MTRWSVAALLGRYFVGWFIIVTLECCLVPGSLAQTAVSQNSKKESKPVAAGAQAVVLPKSVPDPIEPVNRVIWGFNRGIIAGLVKPSARFYRLIVIKPLRTAIGNFGRNVTYQERLINNFLQGKWAAAREERDRFL